MVFSICQCLKSINQDNNIYQDNVKNLEFFFQFIVYSNLWAKVTCQICKSNVFFFDWPN